MNKNILGMIIYIFISFYCVGLVGMLNEKKIARYQLPKTFKIILFLGIKYKNTLNTIIYQISILAGFIISLTFLIFGVFDENIIYSRYVLYNVTLFVFETGFVGWINVKKERRG